MFGNNWDRKLIYKYELAKMRGIQKPIVHGYAGYYVLGPNRERLFHPKKYMSLVRYQYYVEYNGADHNQQVAKFKWHKRLPTFIITKANPEGDELIPNVKFRKSNNVVGKNTISAINSGFFFGYSGLIDNIIHSIIKQTKKKYKIIFTGGLAKMFKNSLKLRVKIKSNLTTDGVLKAAMYLNK